MKRKERKQRFLCLLSRCARCLWDARAGKLFRRTEDSVKKEFGAAGRSQQSNASNASVTNVTIFKDPLEKFIKIKVFTAQYEREREIS